ncbi:MAG: hypothetical protein AAB691_00260, partial [Patescibacteria group bacterium]
MDITIQLAGIWGPVLLAVGIGFFVSTKYYAKIYRDLEKESLAVLIFGVAGMSAGIAHVSIHNLWETAPQIVISLIGWGRLVKSPKFT